MAMAYCNITFYLVLLLCIQPCLAQKSPSTHHNTTGGFTPTTTAVLVALISAFALLTLFSIYINRCAQSHGPRPAGRAAAHTVDVGGHHCRRPRGLDKALIETFPTFIYGNVKARMAAKSGPLECAVCLAEFSDQDELRVLPACCHVFHPDCIDPWLAGATTCPLCRAELTGPPVLPYGDGCALAVPEEEDEEQALRSQQQETELQEVRPVSFTPESVLSFGARRGQDVPDARYYNYRRTQSAMDVPDRHTLRLPENVMKELTEVRMHRRAASLAGYPDAVDRSPRWLATFWRSMSWQRRSRADADAGEETITIRNRVFPVIGPPVETPCDSGSRGEEKRSPGIDALNRILKDYAKSEK